MEEKGLSMLVMLLVVCIFNTHSQAANHPLIPATEVHALLELKDHMADSKGLLGAWDANKTHYICESWVGVTCNRARDHISGIDLGGFELAGSLIPPQLGNLTFLVTLNLSSNNLSGVIPPQLSRCMSLKVLDLYNNNLIGRVPSSLSSLSSLQTLNLCSNSLNGSIPPSLFTNCTSLVYLYLCYNWLTGTIPMELGALSRLLDLNLRQNNLRGVIPSSLTNCTSLEALGLGENQLSGQIPMEIGAQGNLTELLLFNNNLTGVIPPSLGNCTKLLEIALYDNQLIGPVPTVLSPQLFTLFLDGNHLTGPLPSSLSKCKNLLYLQLSTNNLSGSIPTEFGALSSLQVLNLWRNNIIGGIPSTLSNCTHLVTLGLQSNQLTGHIPAELGLLSYLKRLFLWGNRLTGAIPSSLGNCTQLNFLDLDSNQLSGFIPPEVTLLSHMQYLILHNNQLVGFKSLSFTSNFTSLLVLRLESNQMTDNILPQLGNMQQLQKLNLGGNQLSGQISWEFLTNCSSLFELDLSHNYFSGRIASSLGKLQKLGDLWLQGNLLEGTIPNFNEGLPQFTGLLEVDLSFNLLHGPLPRDLLGQVQVSLDLSHNNFSGNLPSWMGKLVMVQAMSFSNNNFFGHIPESLGDCLGLIYLDLSHNNLSGVIPISLGNLTGSLQTLDLSNNHLTGVLPSFLQHLHHLHFLNVSNNNLNGKIPNVGVFKHLNASCFQGNSGLCGPIIQKKCMEQLHRNAHLPWKAILFIALASSTVGTLLLVVALWYIYSHRHKMLPAAINQKFDLLASVEKYTAEELEEATQGYSEENILGEGALAIVYKGILSGGKVVAIKKFKDVSSRQALLEEAQILCRLRHRNLVRVFGCVLNLDVNALVLDFMANGSLENYMHQDECEPQLNLSWEMLMKTAAGVANALTYLHHEYGVPIIHGDVKPSNILLDLDLEAHLADFGLAKLVKGEAISLSSNFKGSIGYMAPEYVNTARITTKVDVYSFGVVVLEMLTGKRATQLDEGISLHQWVKSKLIHSELTHDLLRASLIHGGRDTSSNVPDKEMALQLLKMGVACTNEHPGTRPAMRRISSFFIDRKRSI